MSVYRYDGLEVRRRRGATDYKSVVQEFAGRFSIAARLRPQIMNLMRLFFLLILFLSAALPPAGAESKFTIEPVGGKVTASWKGTADTSGIDLAPTDDEIASLASTLERHSFPTEQA
jgi:hypothetical protein